MAIKNRMWMTGNLEWFAYIGEEEVYLGKREVPIPLENGDTWINQFGDMFVVENDEIRSAGHVDPPERCW